MTRYVVSLGSFRQERIALIEVHADGEGAWFGGFIDGLAGEKTAAHFQREGSVCRTLLNLWQRQAQVTHDIEDCTPRHTGILSGGPEGPPEGRKHSPAHFC